jgi:hypothetical protein
MPDILADYREWREQQAARVSTHSDGCHMWHKDCMIHRLAAALAVEMAKRTPSEPSTPGEGTRQAGCTLTDAEREAIAWAAGLSETRPQGCRTILRSLLERTRNGSPDGCETVR